jgi:Protein of unknown function (DUF1822)
MTNSSGAKANLSRWQQEVFDQDWQKVEEILVRPPAEWSRNFRSRATAESIQRGKLLELEQAGDRVALIVELTTTKSAGVNISVTACPSNGESSLPPDLRLMVLDNLGIAVMQARAKGSQYLQLEFNGCAGERFSVKVILGETSITEAFTI